MKILIEDVEKNREHWLSLRSSTVGSSEVATICGMNEWMTPMELWAEKTGKVPPREETEAMWLGKQFEPTTGQLFARRTGLKVEPANCLAAHDVHEFATASPDFWVYLNACRTVMEAKFTKARNWKFWADGPPKQYLLQLNWQMSICGVESGYIAALIGGDADDFRWEEFPRSQELFEMCLEKAHIFIECVRKDIPPEASEGDAQLIARLQGLRQEGVIELPEQSVMVANEFQDLEDQVSIKNAELKVLKGQLDKCKGQLLLHLGNMTTGKLPDGRLVTAKTVNRKAYQVDATSWVNVNVKA